MCVCSTLHQLVALHEFEGKRFNRYHELGQYALGKRLGDFAVITPQLIVCTLCKCIPPVG